MRLLMPRLSFEIQPQPVGVLFIARIPIVTDSAPSGPTQYVDV